MTRARIQEETRCLGCITPCPQSICELRYDAPPSNTENLLVDALRPSGFEVTHRLSLSQLAQERLGVKSPEVEVLFLTHLLLFLQYLFTRGDSRVPSPKAKWSSVHE